MHSTSTSGGPHAVAPPRVDTVGAPLQVCPPGVQPETSRCSETGNRVRLDAGKAVQSARIGAIVCGPLASQSSGGSQLFDARACQHGRESARRLPVTGRAVCAGSSQIRESSRPDPLRRDPPTLGHAPVATGSNAGSRRCPVYVGVLAPCGRLEARRRCEQRHPLVDPQPRSVRCRPTTAVGTWRDSTRV